jgi:hypothetical protein
VGDASYRLMMPACRQFITPLTSRPGRFVEPDESPVQEPGVDPLHRHFSTSAASTLPGVLGYPFLLESCTSITVTKRWQQGGETHMEPIQSSLEKLSGSFVRTTNNKGMSNVGLGASPLAHKMIQTTVRYLRPQ